MMTTNELSATITNSTLWKNTLGNTSSDKFSSQIEDLRVSFTKFRSNTANLVSQIIGDFDNLTLHDITHLDALWEIASLIVGEDYPLNPMEAFVLGGAFLLHDAALCFEAYKDGKSGVRETLQWKDVHTELLNNGINDEDAQKYADFSAIRSLHASQAEQILEHDVSKNIGTSSFLLEDPTLRSHLGSLIGKIASSHHWDIEQVESEFHTPKNVPNSYPSEWQIDSLKIACILRCADAAHIDNRRAPDFFHALLKRSGISFNHWTAQNKIGIPYYDGEDHSTLLYTSTTDFTENEADAWYVIYDAISVISKEIKSCNNLLERTDGKSFGVKKVKGADSCHLLAKYVVANGWQPSNTVVHVSNIEKIIHNLGGEMLYGVHCDKIEVVFRELIQNARDAVKAREDYDTGFDDGKIKISVSQINSEIWCSITDNGIGMSERVITDTLLDFGTSFWASNLAKSEFPGLRSSKQFNPVGKFGIGFFSIFMLADKVKVFSRRYDKGLDDIIQLEFNNGLSLRPLLKRGKPNGFNSVISTKIEFRLKSGVFDDEDLKIKITKNEIPGQDYFIPLKNYLQRLCAGLDVDIYYEDNRVHTNIYSSEFDKLQWLNDITFADFIDPSIREYNEKIIDRLEFIKDDRSIYGLAAINTERNLFSTQVSTVGGFATSMKTVQRTYDYVGFIDYQPNSAKRDINGRLYSAEGELIKAWAESQLGKLRNNSSLSDIEKYMASSSLSQYGVDPTDLCKLSVSYPEQPVGFVTFEDLATLSKTKGIAILRSKMLADGTHFEVNSDLQFLDNYVLVSYIVNANVFLTLKFDDNNIPVKNNSILDCLYRKIISCGLDPCIEFKSNVGINRFRYPVDAIIITSKDK